jgi:hypothetical protein
MAPIKFIWWVLGVVFTLGLADSFAHLTYQMATAASNAHIHDQISYSAYTRLLWSQPAHHAKNKPRLYPNKAKHENARD